MGDQSSPFATAVLQSMLHAAASDVAQITGCKPPGATEHTVALGRMLTAVRRAARKRNPTVDKATHADIAPETADQATQTEKDISGFDRAHRELSTSQELAVRE